MASASPPGRPAPSTEVVILCPGCKKPNQRRVDNLARARFCQHCRHDVVLNNDGPRYYITRVIKEGGQGAVYEAIDDNLHIYAVKEMLDRFDDPKERDEAIERFEAEAKMLQRIRHPRVPRVYADFKDEGKLYLVMEFVRGEDLEDILKREGKVSEAQALTWMDQICDVIELLHGLNPPIIFRDMKPSNVMIERSTGGVKLIDFGIARVFQPTQRGTQIGTPGYAPPEQYQGIASFESDVYALGATLHHLLTGRDPREHMPFSFPAVRDLNPAISEQTSAAITKALQKIAADRFPSVAAFRAALRPQPVAQPRPNATIQLPSQAVPSNAAQQPVRPTQPPPAPSVPTKPAVQPAPQPKAAQQPSPPPAVAARPATQAQPVQGNLTSRPAQPASPPPAAPQQPTQQPKQQPQRQPWRIPVGGILFSLVAIVLIAATILFLPGISDRIGNVVPQIIPTSIPTAQRLTQRTFTANDLEVVVPSGGDVRAAFTEAFLSRAREQFGANTTTNPNAPPGYVGGEPTAIGDEAGGTRYRASMQGFVLVPQ